MRRTHLYGNDIQFSKRPAAKSRKAYEEELVVNAIESFAAIYDDGVFLASKIHVFWEKDGKTVRWYAIGGPLRKRARAEVGNKFNNAADRMGEAGGPAMKKLSIVLMISDVLKHDVFANAFGKDFRRAVRHSRPPIAWKRYMAKPAKAAA